jgi:hypothetical protein
MARFPANRNATGMNAMRPTRADGRASAAGAQAIDDVLRDTVGYRVFGPGGELGVVTGVPDTGLPPRPLVLVVRAGDTFRFVSVQRVERVLPRLRKLVVR